MIQFRSEYSDILEQLKELKKNLTGEDNTRKIFSKVINIHTLGLIYALLTNQSRDFDNLGNYDSIARNYFESQVRESQMTTFNNHKDEHKNIFLAALEAREGFNYYKNNYLSIAKKTVPIIDEYLLLNFLEERFPEGIRLLEKNRHSISVYLFPEISNHFSTNASVVPNTISNKYSILLKDKPATIEGASILMHELGHVIDSLDLIERGEEYASYTWTYHYLSETISTYLEQSFLEFLIKNDIYREETTVIMSKYFKESFNLLENSFILSLTDANTYKRIIDGTYSKGEVCMMCEESPKDYITVTKNYGDRISGIKEFTYTYGMLLANCMINKDIDINDFLKIRYKDSSYEVLAYIGFNKEVASKSLVKTIDRVFK